MDSRVREVLEGHLPDRVCIIKLAAVLAGTPDPAPAPESEPAPDSSQEGDDESQGVDSSDKED